MLLSVLEATQVRDHDEHIHLLLYSYVIVVVFIFIAYFNLLRLMSILFCLKRDPPLCIYVHMYELQTLALALLALALLALAPLALALLALALLALAPLALAPHHYKMLIVRWWEEVGEKGGGCLPPSHASLSYN